MLAPMPIIRLCMREAARVLGFREHVGDKGAKTAPC